MSFDAFMGMVISYSDEWIGLCFLLMKDAVVMKFGVYTWYGDKGFQFYVGGSTKISTNSFTFSLLSSIIFYDDKGEFI